MSNTINTDVAVKLDITARRNDTFKMLLEVKDPTDDSLMNLSEAQSGGTLPKYQAKMSIVNSSGDRVLTLYSYEWEDIIPTTDNLTHPENIKPEASSEGHYSGGSDVTSCINLENQDGTAGSKVSIIAPYDYMDFQSGEYMYDLQIRFKSTSTTATPEYTTWLYGEFSLRPDITQL
jgi:hypothetical protein